MNKEKYEIVIESGKTKIQAIRKLEPIVNFYLKNGYDVVGGANLFEDENGVPYAYQTMITME